MNSAVPPLSSFGEAFVQLGESREKGCLVAVNPSEALHVFVDDGMVVGAFGADKKGEPALYHALKLPEATCVWLSGAERETKNLKFSIQDYAVRHALAGGGKAAMDRFPAKTVSMSTPQPEKKRVAGSSYHFAAVSQSNFIKIKLFKPTMIVGRANECDMQFDEDERKISRRHCQIRVTPEGVFLRDLDSRNGTYVNGQVIEKEVRLEAGDLVNLGDHAFVLQKWDGDVSRGSAMSLNEVAAFASREERMTSLVAGMISGKPQRVVAPMRKNPK